MVSLILAKDFQTKKSGILTAKSLYFLFQNLEVVLVRLRWFQVVNCYYVFTSKLCLVILKKMFILLLLNVYTTCTIFLHREER